MDRMSQSADAGAPQPMSAGPAPRKPRLSSQVWTLAPGVVLCLVGVGLAYALSLVIPHMSALLIAIVLGVLVRNSMRLHHSVEPGITFSSKKLLRGGIILLGLQLALGDILGLGLGIVALVVAVVALGLSATALIGRALGLSRAQSLLIACGFSICGAAAVAGAEGVIQDKDEEDTVSAVALVVVFGTLMIPLVPLLSSALSLTPGQAAIWTGASVHEVAQVVAIGGTLGGAALGVAVVVKLARVLMLAPVMAWLSVMERRRAQRKAADGGAAEASISLPPIIPLFVALFIAMVIIRSLGIVPAAVVEGAGIAQTLLLGAAMFALGTGVRLSLFTRLGAKPFILAAVSTLLMLTMGLTGALLLG